MAYDNLLVDIRERVLHITLNRPEKVNAMSGELMAELFEALQAGEDAEDVGAVVIKGAGRSFCSGYDIRPVPGRKTGQDMTIREDIMHMERRHRRWSILWNLNKPTIAQVHGYCVAGGTDLAQHCDLIIAAEDAQFGFPPIRAQGSPPTHMWTYNVGPQWAKYMLLSGDLIDGRTAAEIGLAWKAVPAERLEEAAHSVAKRMAMTDPELLAANKAICNKAIELMGRGMLQQLALETDAIGHKAPAAMEFRRIARADGLRAALAWRDGRFSEKPAP